MKKIDKELDALHIGRPTIESKATEAIEDIIKFIPENIDLLYDKFGIDKEILENETSDTDELDELLLHPTTNERQKTLNKLKFIFFIIIPPF